MRKSLKYFGWLFFAAAVMAATSSPAKPGARLAAKADPVGVCGTAAHCVQLAWTESSTGAITFNVFRGTAPGTEGATPINAAPLTTMAYVDPATLTANAQTFYYVVQAVETSGGIVATSPNSNEVSATFPGIPAAPSVSAPVVN